MEPDVEFMFHLVEYRHAIIVGGSEVPAPNALSVGKLHSNIRSEPRPIAWGYGVDKLPELEAPPLD
jgi:hypothetical protein